MLGGKIGLGGQDFVQLFLCPQIDAAKPLAVVFQTVEPLFDFLRGWEIVSRRDTGEADCSGPRSGWRWNWQR
jgi:hypothetical protein